MRPLYTPTWFDSVATTSEEFGKGLNLYLQKILFPFFSPDCNPNYVLKAKTLVCPGCSQQYGNVNLYSSV